MTAYVLLLKEYETDETVVYKFGPNEKSMGNIALNKGTRMISEVEAIPDDNIRSSFYFDRAAQRLTVCLLKEGGVFPDRTTFES